MESILQRMLDEPVDLTYVGIGSCPYVTPGEKLPLKQDQLIPKCFHEFILEKKKQIRCIHFDPNFDRTKEFLISYFTEWGLQSTAEWIWRNEYLEVILVPSSISHNDHYWFFESLCETLLNTKGKLVIQEYTGYELKDLNMKLFRESSLQEKFKRRILLDMTFGTDMNCCTDMTKAQPYYDYDGNFINLHFLKEQEVKRWIGISMSLDKLITTKFIAKFLQVLNYYHVDYRRRLKGDTCLYGSSDYTNETSPDEIMKILQEKLLQSFDILLLTKHVTKSDYTNLLELFQKYKDHDPYKWYAFVEKLIPRP